MARFDSPGDALLVLVKYYERTNSRGYNFTQWLWSQMKGLLGSGYVVDEGVEISPIRMALLGNVPPPPGSRFKYHLTEEGERYLQAVLTGDDQNPVHIPDRNFEADRDMMRDIRDNERKGRVVFSLPNHYKKDGG